MNQAELSLIKQFEDNLNDLSMGNESDHAKLATIYEQSLRELDDKIKENDLRISRLTAKQLDFSSLSGKKILDVLQEKRELEERLQVELKQYNASSFDLLILLNQFNYILEQVNIEDHTNQEFCEYHENLKQMIADCSTVKMDNNISSAENSPSLAESTQQLICEIEMKNESLKQQQSQFDLAVHEYYTSHQVLDIKISEFYVEQNFSGLNEESLIRLKERLQMKEIIKIHSFVSQFSSNQKKQYFQDLNVSLHNLLEKEEKQKKKQELQLTNGNLSKNSQSINQNQLQSVLNKIMNLNSKKYKKDFEDFNMNSNFNQQELTKYAQTIKESQIPLIILKRITKMSLENKKIPIFYAEHNSDYFNEELLTKQKNKKSSKKKNKDLHDQEDLNIDSYLNHLIEQEENKKNKKKEFEQMKRNLSKNLKSIKENNILLSFLNEIMKLTPQIVLRQQKQDSIKVAICTLKDTLSEKNYQIERILNYHSKINSNLQFEKQYNHLIKS